MNLKKRSSYVSEIKNRNPPLITSSEILKQRLNSLENTYSNLNKYDKETLRYFPIAIVGLFEAYFKHAFQELIDFGSPFSDNSLKILKKSQGFDDDVIKSLNERVRSLGELVSFFIKVSSLEKILETIGTLVYNEEKNFKKEIEKELVKIHKDEGNEQEFELKHLFSDVEETFRLRHIFCHEAAISFTIEMEKIKKCYLASKCFLKIMNRFLFNTKFPNSSHLGFLTQYDMNVDQQAIYAKKEIVLNNLIFKIKSNQTKRERYFFEKVLKNWRKYREIKAKFLARETKGGTLWFTVYYGQMSGITEDLIKELEANFSTYCTFSFPELPS